MFVKPKSEYKILDLVRKDRLPPEGREVDANNIYWATLLRDGDIVPAEPPARPDPAPLHAQPKSSDTEA